MTFRGPVAWIGMALLTLGLSAAAPQATRADDTPWLGVTLQSLNDGLREGMGYDGDGVLVSSVLSNSPAERAGLRSGDVILRFNGRTATSPDQLTKLVRDTQIGQSVNLTIVRNGDRRTLSARLGNRPDDVDFPPDPSTRIKVQDPGDMESHDHDMEMHDKDVKDLGDLKAFHDLKTFEGMPGMMGMSRGRLGVRTQDLSEDLAPYFDVPAGSGALVLEVLKDTPAERAGIKAGDVIVRVGDSRISGSEELARATRSAPEGQVTVSVLRHGSRRNFEPELGAASGWDSGSGFGSGNDRVIIRDPSGNTRSYRSRGSRDQEMQQLRDEVRRLREELKGKDQGDDEDDD